MLYLPNRYLKEHLLFIKYCIFWLFLFFLAYWVPNSGWFFWQSLGFNLDFVLFLIIFQLESPSFFYHADALPKGINSGYFWVWKSIDSPAKIRKYNIFSETYFNPIFVARFYCYMPLISYLGFCFFNPNWFFFEFLFLFGFLWLDFFDEMGNDMVEADLDEDLISPTRFLRDKSLTLKHEFTSKSLRRSRYIRLK